MPCVLLVNSPINTEGVLGRFSGIRNTLNMIPTGLAYIASSLEEHGIEVSLCDAYARELSSDDIANFVEVRNPLIVGIGATTTNIKTVFAIAQAIKSKRPMQKIVLGGIHPSTLPEETLSHPAVDFVIREEGEYALIELYQALLNSNDFSGIKGLSYKQGGTLFHNPLGSPIPDLDRLPLPAYHLLPMERYSAPPYMLIKKPVFQMIASRGCPYSCVFCVNAVKYASQKYRSRDLDKVIDEMEMLHEKYRARQIMFWDPNFPLNKKQALSFSEKIIARGLQRKFIWVSTPRVETIDEEVASELYRCGCRALGFGIESGSERLLKSIGKTFTRAQVEYSVRAASEAGIITVGSFILGLPEESPIETQETVDFAKSLDLDFAQFSLLVPYPGTPLYERLKAEGRINSFNWDSFNQSVGLSDNEPVFVPEGYSAKLLAKAHRDAYRQFYFRWKLFGRHARRLKSFDRLALYFHSALALCRL